MLENTFFTILIISILGGGIIERWSLKASTYINSVLIGVLAAVEALISYGQIRSDNISWRTYFAILVTIGCGTLSVLGSRKAARIPTWRNPRA